MSESDDPTIIEAAFGKDGMVDGHPEIPAEDTADEAVEFLERKVDAGYDPSDADDALLYELLGTGTMPWKVPKEAADYQDAPNGNAYCGNCSFSYYSNETGKMICSKMRGYIDWDGWCRLWGQADPDPHLEEKFGIPDGVDKEAEADVTTQKTMSNDNSEPDVVEVDTTVDQTWEVSVVEKSTVDSVESDVESDEFARKDEGMWVPYIGDRGGSGWQNTETDEVEYQDEPPGEQLPAEDIASDVIGLDAEQQSALLDPLDEWMERTDAINRDALEDEVMARVVQRHNEFGGVDDAEPENVRRFVNSIADRVVNEAEQRAEMNEWERALDDNFSQQDMENISNHINQMIRNSKDMVGATEDEFEAAMAERLRVSQFVERANDGRLTPAQAERALEDAVQFAQEDIAEDADPMDLLDDEIKDSDRFDPEPDIASAIKDVAGTFTDELNEFRQAQSVEAGLEAAAEVSSDSKLDFIQQVENSIERELYPFADFNGRVADAFDPTQADEVTHMPDHYIDGGRSENSMYIADGVPDENGNERRLFVTNTNRNRGSGWGNAQNPEDGERCTAGSHGFQAAGVPVARYENVEGEFWISEGVGGEKAMSGSVDYTDLDNPVEQFVEMFAVGSALGAVDFHGENVHVDPDSGDLIAVDLDLIGEGVWHDRDTFKNRYGFGQSSMLDGRGNRLFNDLNLGDADGVDDFAEVKEAIKLRSKQLTEDGTLRDVVSAATSASTNRDINTTIEENLMRLESDDFWADDVPAVDGGMDTIRSELGLPPRDDDDESGSLKTEVQDRVEPNDIRDLDDDVENQARGTEPAEEPFVDYAGCVDYHDDKRDPEAYCAVVFGFNESTVDEDEEDDDYDESDEFEIGPPELSDPVE